LDEAFREIGHWVERPARITELQQAMRRNLFAHDPMLAGFAADTPVAQLPEDARMRVRQAFSAFREEQRVLADREVIREIRAIVERSLTPTLDVGRQATLDAALRIGSLDRRIKRPIKVSITYCASCGYEPQTLALASALMQAFLYDLASIELIPWEDG